MVRGRRRQETFYEAQRRHRRSGWRFSVLSGLAVVLLGFPLSILVSPFVTAVGLMAIDVVNLVVPLPDATGDAVHFLDRLFGTDRAPSGALRTGDPVGTGELATAATVLAVPGMALMGLTWLGVRRLVVRSGAGAVVLAARARPPRPGDVEERQLVNLVDELALAAGIPAPRVMLLDSRLVNAAVVGRSVDDATLLFPRRMLDDLDRGPTGAVVADLLAVVVNGDLRIALVISSVFHTFDLVAAALGAPFHRETRAALWQLCRLAVRRRPRRDDGEAQFVAETLARAGADPWAGAGDEDDDGESKGGCWNAGLQLPFFFASLAYTITRLIVDFVLVVPLMSALWRRRRRLLADATALELTRDPASLARAFDYLAAHGNSIAGPWTHLFVVGPEVAHERAQRQREQREAGTACDHAGVAVDLPRDPTADLGPSFGGGHDLDGFLPPLRKRRERLAAMAMGEVASVDAGDAGDAVGSRRLRPWPRPQPRHWFGVLAGTLAAGMLLLVVAGLLLVVLGLSVYLMLCFQLIVLLPPVLPVHGLLR